MKTIALASVLVAAVAAPSFASDSLARSLNVEPGVYSTAQLIQLRDAVENQDTAYIDFILSGAANGSAFSVNADAEVAEFRARVAQESDEFQLAAAIRNAGNEVISTQSFGHNDRASAIFAQLAIEAEDDE